VVVSEGLCKILDVCVCVWVCVYGYIYTYIPEEGVLFLHLDELLDGGFHLGLVLADERVLQEVVFGLWVAEGLGEVFCAFFFFVCVCVCVCVYLF
jgi:hypothetical protein